MTGAPTGAVPPADPPTGRQWTIRHGAHEAVVIELGAGLRRYAVAGVDLVAGYAADARPDAGRGQVLMPWPNRVRDGRYAFGGTDQQLALSEPKKGNATHGLVRWSTWQLREQRPDEVTLGLRLLAGQGWDWPLDLRITYRVDDTGLHVTPGATNIGTAPAPFGYGHHPYLTTGEDSLDQTTLQVPAATRFTVDDRLIPVGRAPVEGESDLRRPRPLAGVTLDTAFTDLSAGDDGTWQVVLTRDATEGDGAGPPAGVVLWAPVADFPYVQCFTGDTLPGGRARTTGLAVEPMTCPADALNSGTGLRTLAPGQSWSATWGIRPR